ncbi:hypothetical protein HDU97_007847 [Phlyctochytrium planicorne]|nr:hypothetical protein HDU97_007847 [Phlyctochytrium planicorne]
MGEKVIVIAGFGPGISYSVAEKFGKAGYKLALVARTQSKVDNAAAEFSDIGVPAQGFATDLSKPDAAKKLIRKIRDFGSIAIIFWNPSGSFASVLNASIQNLVDNFNLSTTSLLVAVQEAIDDLRANQGAILVTGGGMALENDMAVKFAVERGAGSAVIAESAARKAVFLLNETLKDDKVYAGEVTVLGRVGGTATLTPDAIAEAFWEIEQGRDKVHRTIS